MEGDGDVFPQSSPMDGDRLKTGDLYQGSPRLEEEREQIVLSQTRNQRGSDGAGAMMEIYPVDSSTNACFIHLNVSH